VGFLSEFQRDLNFASDWNGVPRLNEAAIQADATNDPSYARARADYNSRRYLTAKATENSSFNLAKAHQNLWLQARPILRLLGRIDHQGRFVLLNINWPGTAIKAFIAVNTVERTQQEKP
jgi:hypothetical protein